MYCLRRPELLDVPITEYFELCVLKACGITSCWSEMSLRELQAYICNWRENGLIDMRMHCSLFTREVFQPRYVAFLYSVFVVANG